MDWVLDLSFVAIKTDGHHVVGVKQAVVVVKTVALRPVLFEMTQVPFTDANRRVAFFPQCIGDGYLISLDASRGLRVKHAVDARANGQTPGQQGGPAG